MSDSYAEWRSWTGKIRVNATCVFRRGEQILVARASDPARNLRFWFLPGGGVEFGETTEEAVRREVREELGADLTDLRRLEVLENVFTHDGEPFHQIVFVYEGRFTDPATYGLETFIGDAPEWETSGWRDLDSFGEEPLYPEGLLELLRGP